MVKRLLGILWNGMSGNERHRRNRWFCLKWGQAMAHCSTIFVIISSVNMLIFMPAYSTMWLKSVGNWPRNSDIRICRYQIQCKSNGCADIPAFASFTRASLITKMFTQNRASLLPSKSLYVLFLYIESWFIDFLLQDNFAHDAVRYNLNPTPDLAYLAPLETYVSYDPTHKHFEEEFEPVHDPLIQRYLRLRDQTSYSSPLKKPSLGSRLRQHFPLAPNVSPPEFIPTMQMYFLERLHARFPRHRLILSDFDALPTQVEGVNAPVVQTRQRGLMIPCSTYMVSKGWFDIFFPTQFELMQEMYALITASSKQKRHTVVQTHREFLEKYGNVQATCTKSGENPMLENYQNMKFFLT